ncbi:hypothetical protein WJU16_03125 [Chitinophaga pollutisoli]|uniref:Uncharacterized protein n=1 Tax=Chitinophaga pollutisoli TaxID=3133966 RepID=A0ABZ2YQI5_9BACT
MSSYLNPLLRSLSQFDYCSIGALYLLEYQQIQAYVQLMSIDAIKAHFISIDAFSKTIRRSKNFKTWEDLVAHAKLTAKAAGEKYIDSVPDEIYELPVDFALNQCMGIFDTNTKLYDSQTSTLYREKALGQFGSLEEIMHQYLHHVSQNHPRDLNNATAKAVSNLEYMRPRHIMRMLIKINRFLSSRPTKVQHLYKDVMLEGTNNITVEEVPEVYSLGFCNYELHRTIFLFVAPLLNHGWPYAMLCYRLRNEIIKKNPRSLALV